MEKPNNIQKNDWDLLIKKYPKNIKKILRKIKKGYPIQYLIGSVDFFGCQIMVNRHVLIPRFETELFVDLIKDKIKLLFETDNISIIDCGTGSGCIAIKLKTFFPESKMIAIDKSKKVLEIANLNAKNNQANIMFKQKKFSQINEKGIDVIVSNPPYIGLFDEVDDNVKKYEPKKALFALKEGTTYYDQILKISREISNKKSLICFEIGQNQAQKIKSLAMYYYPDSTIEIHKDYCGKDRYIFVINKCEKRK